MVDEPMNGCSYAQCATPPVCRGGTGRNISKPCSFHQLTLNREPLNFDELVKSRKTPFFVIPAKAGIQFFQLVA
jgi:hypothetical protein